TAPDGAVSGMPAIRETGPGKNLQAITVSIFYLLLFAAKEINSQRDCQQHSKDQAINKNHR
ncbi:hypothetical protein EYY20_16055, partial [Escherichia coli]